MGIKLLNAVSMTPTTTGMILRIADKLLPIQGKGIVEIFRRLRPFLSGEWSIKHICQHLAEPDATKITEFLGQLAAAGMIRERDAQENSELSLIPSRLKAYLSRIETYNTSPVSAYRKFCGGPLRIYGDATLAGFLVDGARLVGISDATYQAKPVARQRYSSHLRSTTVEGANRLCPCDQKNIPVCNIVAATLFEYEKLCRLIATSDRINRGMNAYFLSCQDRVLVGVLPTHGAMGIQQALSDYAVPMGEAQPSFPANPSRLYVTAARILMLHLVDSYAGTVSQDDWSPILEISESGKIIRTRPFPRWIYVRDVRFRTSNLMSEIRSTRLQTLGDKVRLAQSMQECLVDSYTGLVRAIDEGKLPQIPHHQCGVICRNSGSNADVYLNDSGRDAAEARISAMLRGIEHFLIQVTCGDAIPSRRYARHGISQGDEMAVIFAAGVEGKPQVHIDAVYRVLARYADRREVWQAPEDMEEIFDFAPLSCAYLRDIGELHAVKYQRTLIRSDVQVVRFKYADRTISVVAGNGSGIWESGLRDVWSYITGTKTCPANCSYLESTRYRYSGGEAKTDAHVLDDIRREWGIEIRIDDVSIQRDVLPFVSLCRAVALRPSNRNQLYEQHASSRMRVG